MKARTKQRKKWKKVKLRNISFLLYVGSLIFLMAWGSAQFGKQNGYETGAGQNRRAVKENPADNPAYYTNTSNPASANRPEFGTNAPSVEKGGDISPDEKHPRTAENSGNSD